MFEPQRDLPEPSNPAVPPVIVEPAAPPPPPRRRPWWPRAVAAALLLLFVAAAWLAITAPLSRSLRPTAPPSVTLLAADGTPIARKGAIIDRMVDVGTLPDHVGNAFVAIEDRRFYSHWGIDPRGILRAAWSNMRAGGVVEGGSTITQQLGKVAFLDSDRTMARKLREAMIAVWLELWLTKREILSRYLSNVYFGDNVYGLRAAAQHYFSKSPEKLSVSESAMLAGLMKAPSRLAPSTNLSGARARQKLVVAAMAREGFLTEREARAARPARLRLRRIRTLPTGTYFADWAMPAARDKAGAVYAEQTVRTTLDSRIQKAAVRAVNRAALGQAQVAIVAMRPDGRVVAMVGGRDYKASSFNRATQARRQPGSTFKLFVYLAALRAGMTPDDMVEDEKVTVDGWTPENNDRRYRGAITLRRAFALSSNVAAVRLAEQVGRDRVMKAARDLGIRSPLTERPSVSLGTSGVTLIELTAAYAAVAAGNYPVLPQGLPPAEAAERGWLQSLWDRRHRLSTRERDMLLDLLAATVREGTGRAAALAEPSFGKTGTTQDHRDAIFVGFAGDLVTGVWVGRDDNKPIPGMTGGTLPARIWRDFMAEAIGSRPLARPKPVVDPEPDVTELGDLNISTDFGGMSFDLGVGEDGLDIRARPSAPGDEALPPVDDAAPPPRAEDEIEEEY
ncbi:transglycosylase domain-containing protein [Sphingomonas jatrophae]|uniref:Penicillin-binding protein 1A n=1 Tax=Sphingomonas jatrophae TaxID=1166337 RepID=A0A1I6JNU3_9SPHN|nr:PBP1A family penicillin-binding protein [Sphingomonas jatrophae]SFR80581.1 penicillin-binding protein 1A [Sphingomonas jatrophae]